MPQKKLKFRVSKLYFLLLMVLLNVFFAITASATDYIVELTKSATEIEEYEMDDFRKLDFFDSHFYVTDNLELIQNLDELGFVVYYEEDVPITIVEPYYEEEAIATLSAVAEDEFDITKAVRDKISNVFAGREYKEGEHKVKVAIIDSGIEIYDENSQVRAEFTNVVDGNSFVDSYPYKDDTNHGTPAAGLIGGQFSGIAPNCELISLKAFNDKTGSVSSVASAIRGAVDTYGCKVINISATVKSDVSALKNAVKHAIDKGAIIVASTGNYGHLGSPVCYPAGYDGVIGVGAVNRAKEWAYFSCANTTNDVCALGEDVYAPVSYSAKSEYYGYVSGTSFSCPQVAGLAALLCTYDYDMTPAEFLKILEATSVDSGDSGYDIKFGHGIMDVKEALEMVIRKPEIYSSRMFANGENLNYKIYNNTSGSETFMVIKANYDSYDRLINFEPVEITVESKEVKPISDAITCNVADGEYFRVMLWRSLDTMTPLFKTREY